MPYNDVGRDNATEKSRQERCMTRAITKRTTIIASIRAIHALSLRADKEPGLIPELLISVDGLDALWSDFNVEDNAVLDCLIELDAVVDYSPDLVPEVRGLVNAAKAVAALYRTATNVDHVHTTPIESNTHTHASLSRLPEIPLPQFNGNLHNWATFRDRFTALVDTRPGLAKNRQTVLPDWLCERFCC
ncbi:uncharacterized protein LOC112680838 [Sipha flava]|uniref:Uncharacterized protein LOC112680838 n=1 Tax=Sipha flava TaxID=143950 RepID=A0A8B8F7V6_9HEMI|nr:uncharacterized protein LOC112680838 [Sipha flava]